MSRLDLCSDARSPGRKWYPRNKLGKIKGIICVGGHKTNRKVFLTTTINPNTFIYNSYLLAKGGGQGGIQ